MVLVAQAWGIGLGFGIGPAAAVGSIAAPTQAVEPVSAYPPSGGRRTADALAPGEPGTGTGSGGGSGGGSGAPPAGLTDGSTPIRAPGAAEAVEPSGSGVLGSTGLGAATGTATNAAAGAATGTGSVNQLLHNRIRAGDLPLPGQATAVPDAFAIATVLLPSGPQQGRSPQDARSSTGDAQGASPGGASGQGDRLSHLPLPPGGGLPGDGATARGQGSTADGWNGGTDARGAGAAGGRAVIPSADGLSGLAVSAHTVELTASRDGGRVGAVGGPNAASGLTGTGAPKSGGTGPSAPGRSAAEGGTASAEPLAATGSQDAVLIPIAAGLLLTGAAMYKHRGLPRGH
ncbi:hypothetical protein [Kitasatospora kifunensis]|uniref:Uncharacterized protein n=1 Tax=Kitasatospora kifunensis TaxID=58351 RepID=A0A7W7R550_KITKI|nr:hypothetical protein [Kitasatospora kifunensis]MBB4925592.1 hypothetical protein [Kitasatospora kifunensis]